MAKRDQDRQAADELRSLRNAEEQAPSENPSVARGAEMASGIGQTIKPPAKPRTIGQRRIDFETLPNYNWRVKSAVESSVKRVMDPETGAYATMTTARKRASQIQLTLYRMERDGKTGNSERREYTRIIDLKNFVTFDNWFTEHGFSTEDVARAVWNSSGFQRSIAVIPMTAEEVEHHWTLRESPDVREMRERLSDPAQYEELRGLNDLLLGQALPGEGQFDVNTQQAMAASGVAPAMPQFPAFPLGQ